jgi:lipopolysaccharide export system permease protein
VKSVPAIDRYIFRLVLMPMLAVFVIAASLLILDKMLKLFEFVGNEGGPISVVFRMLANLLPEYASLAIPLGLLMGILFAFRKLATTSELDVLRGVGLSYTRLLRVPYAITLVLAGVNLLIVGYLQPQARYWYEQMDFELRSGALGASIKVGEFTTLQDRVALRIEQSQDNGRQLSGIWARFASPKGEVVTISAREGRFLSLKDNPNTIILRLTDGQLIHDEPGTSPRVLSFSRHDMPIDLPAIEKFRERGGKEREYILPELLRIGWSDQVTQKVRNETRASLNFRIVEVVMMLLLPLLGVALAVPPKRSSSPLGVFISIIMVVSYHKINEYGQAAAAQGRFPPEVILWGPFVLFAALILWMYWRVAYVPGGQPIGALEKFFAVLGKRITALLKRNSRKTGIA